MKIHYKVSWLIYGNYWGGVKGVYPARSYEGEDLEAIRKLIRSDLKDGSLDGGMGYESLIGAYMTIEMTSTLIYQGREYSNSDWESEFYGELSEEEEDFLMECNIT